MSHSTITNSHLHFRCETLVIGGGIAGCWTALKLAERGINTMLVFYQGEDRGGRLGSTNLSVGAISSAPLQRRDYTDWLQELGRGQVHSSVTNITAEYLQEELDELRRFDPLRQIDLGLALASGSAKMLTEQLLTYLQRKGVVVLRDAWVVRIDASENECRGIQFQRNQTIGSIAAASIVIASGGYSGLFHGSVRTGTYGSIHGRFLQAGGKLSNLEFIFRHGYGQPDLGKLTPTEELPGAEIYDEQGAHVCWLEEELFYGRGTHNHFQAFMTWRKEESKKYFIDFRYCGFHRQFKNFLALTQQDGFYFQQKHFSDFDDYIAEEYRPVFRGWLVSIVQKNKTYDFAEFNAIKPWMQECCAADKHRIRQIAYFSMGGIMHHGFLTNLKNVYVNGEAMHDYGAHRVGGLPWALYLCAARKIADDICTLKKRTPLYAQAPSLIPRLATFDKQLLQELQLILASLENGKTEAQLKELAHDLQSRRRHHPSTLDDGYAYLLMAEAIVQSYLVRKESRGCFFRPDYIQEDFRLSRCRTLVSFNAGTGEVRADLIDKIHMLDLILNRPGLKEKIYGLTEKNNAAFFLVKKHLTTTSANSTAIVCNGHEWTYEALSALIDRYAFFLFSQGMVRGDRIAIHLRDSTDWIAIFLAALQLGLVAVPLNTFAKEAELYYFLQDSQAELLISEQALLGPLNFDVLSERLRTRIISLDDIHPLPSGHISCCVPVEATAAGFILYTSGSTGSPKGAVHSHADLEFTATHFARTQLNPQPGDKFYSTSRLFFAYGLGNSMTFPLYFGSTVVLSPQKLSEADTLSLLQNEKINYFFSIPTLYNKLFSIVSEAFDTSSLKLCISAGEPLAPKLGQRWAAKTARPLLDGIGSTEALHIFCCNTYFPNAAKTLGQPVPGYQLKLLDDNNFAVDKADTPANLAISGGSLASGYWNNAQASKHTFLNDLLLTGDIYSRSENGDYIFWGRKGDGYKVAGLWVSGIEVEMILKELEYIQDAALVCFLTPEAGQKVAAFIVPKQTPGGLASHEIPPRVLASLPTLISRHKLPNYLFVCGDLPRTATGKIIKATLKERAESYFKKQPDQLADELCFTLLDTEAV